MIAGSDELHQRTTVRPIFLTFGNLIAFWLAILVYGPLKPSSIDAHLPD